MHETIQLMLEEIASQGNLFDASREDLMIQCRSLIKEIGADRIKKVYIAGCGDSFYAGINCRDLFLKYASLHTEAWQALEFSRYVCNYEVDESSLVICISNSGKVSRTVECAIRAQEKGAVVIGYTSNKESPLAKACSYQVFTTVPQYQNIHIPGTFSYGASMMGLVCMAIALGEARGALSGSQVTELCDYIHKLGQCVKPTVEACSPMIERYTDIYLGEDSPLRVKLFHFVGSGPNWGNAQYASEKMLESARFDAVCQGTEEWAHTQYFTTRVGTHTVILAPRGESRERAIEIMQAVTVMDGKKIVIGEDSDQELRRSADIYFPICGMENIREEFSPLIYPIPIALLSMHLGRVLGAQAFGFDKPWILQENLRQIWESKVVSLQESKQEDR